MIASARTNGDTLQPRIMRDPGIERVLDTGDRKTSTAMESILVATDFSEGAARALERAVLLTNEVAPARLTVLHADSPSSMPALLRRRDGDREPQSATTRIRELARHVRERTGIRVDERIVSGKTVPTLRRFAADADLTIVGTSDVRPLRDFTIGSTVQRLARRLERPMLVVNRHARARYRQVVVAVDLATDPATALASARALAPGAKLNLLHAYRAPYEPQLHYAGVSEEAIYSHRAEARMAAASALTDRVLSHLPESDVRLLLTHGYPVPTLLQKASDVGADLLVVRKSEPSLVRELLVESVTQQVIGRSRCDVLVVP
jgi:nucleotide-binding universal stress UspA family protein